jgi:hypothetical protein
MASRRLSALRPSLLGPSCARWGIAPLLRLADRRRTPTGLPRSAPGRCDRGGCPLYSGAGVPARRQVGPACPCPTSPSWSPIGPAISHDEASSRIHSRSPVRSCPDLGWPDGSASPSALPLASHPAVTDGARRDWAQASGTCLGREALPSTPPVRPRVAPHSLGLYHRMPYSFTMSHVMPIAPPAWFGR